MRTAYKCRACPDSKQAAQLGRTFGCVRLVWNKTLAERHTAYHQRGEKTSYQKTDAALTGWKKTEGLAFLSEVSSVPLQQTLRRQHSAFANFFAKRARYPRFKNRAGRQSAHYTRSAFRIRDGRLWLAKQQVPLRLAWSFDDVDLASLKPTTVIVSREADGRWYVTFAVETTDPDPDPRTGREIGLDLGVKDFAVTSDGDKIANPRHLERKARNLARYQRRMARKRRGSANRRKAKVAAAHRKVRHARQDFLHKTTTRLVRDHDPVAIEDLHVAGMVRNRRLARAISDCGWGEFRRQLEYKCERAGRTLVVIDRWFPSSKTCSACGYLLTTLSLGTRHWTCPSCRTRHDRDVNAATNTLAAGRAAARENPGDACGAGVRRQGPSLPQSATKQETGPVRAEPQGSYARSAYRASSLQEGEEVKSSGSPGR
jgi:putative transposase